VPYYEWEVKEKKRSPIDEQGCRWAKSLTTPSVWQFGSSPMEEIIIYRGMPDFDNSHRIGFYSILKQRVSKLVTWPATYNELRSRNTALISHSKARLRFSLPCSCAFATSTRPTSYCWSTSSAFSGSTWHGRSELHARTTNGSFAALYPPKSQ
jgi:hypothetical protein